MLSDGNSAAYKAVCDMAPYGTKTVSMLECMNHAHKRKGTALRKLARKEWFGGRDVSRLTENKCDSLQNFYRGAILDNLPNINKMRAVVHGRHCTIQCPLMSTRNINSVRKG